MKAWHASLLVAACTLLAVMPSQGEQMQRLGPLEVHYVVVNSTFFSNTIAERYGIVRGRDRAVVNLSVLNTEGSAVPVVLEGTVTNLLGQVVALEFREVREGEAVYYLAAIRHTDQETLRFALTVTAADGIPRSLRFQQQMYWGDP